MQPRSRGHGPLNLSFVIDGTVRYKDPERVKQGLAFRRVHQLCFCDDGLYISARNIDGRSLPIGDGARVGT